MSGLVGDAAEHRPRTGQTARADDEHLGLELLGQRCELEPLGAVGALEDRLGLPAGRLREDDALGSDPLRLGRRLLLEHVDHLAHGLRALRHARPQLGRRERLGP